MKEYTIYHNPRCSKSRQTMALLEEHGITPSVRLYLQSPLDRQEIQALLDKLDLPLRDLIRSGETVFKENQLSDPAKTEEDLWQALLANPILLQRPIVEKGQRAVIGRPPENVLGLLES